MSAIQEFLSAGSAPPAIKFPVVGTEVSGTINGAPKLVQQRDYKTKALLEWPDGQPKMQLVIPLLLDDGTKGSLYVKSGLRDALHDALDDAGVQEPAMGGHLTVSYVGDEPVEGVASMAKIYQMEYRPPATPAKAHRPVVNAWTDDIPLPDEPPPF